MVAYLIASSVIGVQLFTTGFVMEKFSREEYDASNLHLTSFELKKKIIFNNPYELSKAALGGAVMGPIITPFLPIICFYAWNNAPLEPDYDDE